MASDTCDSSGPERHDSSRDPERWGSGRGPEQYDSGPGPKRYDSGPGRGMRSGAAASYRYWPGTGTDGYQRYRCDARLPAADVAPAPMLTA